MPSKRILKVKEGCCLLVVATLALVFLGGCLGRPGVRRGEELPHPPLLVPARLITVTVEGANHVMLRELRGKLSALEEVGNVHQRRFAAYQISELEIEYRGLIETLADQMLDMSFANFSLEIVSFDATGISVRTISER